MSAQPHKIFRHGKLTEVAPGLFRVWGSLPFPLSRNMFVYKLPDGGLLLYSVVALDEPGMKALEALGRPAVMVVPHPFHVMDAPFYAARYPDLKIVGMASAQARVPAGVRIDASPADALPPLGVRFHLAAGMKVDELVLELPLADGAGTALLFTDLVGQSEGKPGLMMKILGPPGGAGVARIVRWRQINDKAAVRGFLLQLAETPGLSTIAGCHGGVVTQGAQAWLKHAATTI